MRVFNESKTNEIFYYDLESGWLKNDTIVLNHHAEIPAFEGVGHYEYKNYPNGGKDKVWVWDVSPVEAVPARDETEEILVYIPFTAEEIKKRRIAKIKERLSQLSEDFVQAWVGAQIDDLATRKREFAELHNELRVLLDKAPRFYGV
jgi:hypothetical protein